MNQKLADPRPQMLCALWNFYGKEMHEWIIDINLLMFTEKDSIDAV